MARVEKASNTKTDYLGTALKTGVVAVGLGATVLAFREFFKKEDDKDTLLPASRPSSGTSVTRPSSSGASSASWTDGTFPLRYGQRNNRKVLRLQQALIRLGGTPATYITGSGGADGWFGDGTRRALEASRANGNEVAQSTYNGFLLKAGMDPVTGNVTGGTTAAAAPAPATTDLANQVTALYNELNRLGTDNTIVKTMFLAKDDAYLKAFQTAYNAKYGAKYGANALVYHLGNNNGLFNDLGPLIINFRRVAGLSGLGDVAGKLDTFSTLDF